MDPLKVMSFNLRVEVPEHGHGHPDHWPTRFPAMVSVLGSRRPHLVGSQEGLWHQLRPMLDELPHYGLVGTGRDGGSNAEYSAILYDRERLELEGWDQWWLSPTPTVIGSSGWGSSCTRIAVIAELSDRASGERVTMINTHLDHVSDEARTRAAETIAARVPSSAALVTGDFNCAAGSAQAWQVLRQAGLDDSWLVAGQQLGDEISTFHGYTEPGDHEAEVQVPAGSIPGSSEPADRIDWIMTTPDWTVIDAEIVTERPAGVWPSDHWPVAATLVR